ncbi:MAG TPA: hypothetical protein VFT16_05025 [Candidatus Saccharimonadales bacterium]|nr:hypothetical protein [Candidatus Saccharimonadales bacterium]
MASNSLHDQAKALESQISSILSFYDISELPMQQKDLVTNLKHQLVDIRLDARDYEYAETRAEQLQHAKEGKQRLGQLEQSILKASEYNMFGAVDVAHISAGIEQLISGME